MNGITTKFIAALTVFAMVLAGAGVMAVAEDNDADDTNKTLKLVFDGVFIDDSDKVLSQFASDATVSYVATLNDDFEEDITIFTKDYYDAMKDACTIKGGVVTFEIGDITVDPTDKKYTADDVEQGLIIFTSFEVSKTDVISGVSTRIEFKGVVTENIVYNLVFTENAEAAVEAAVAIVEAFYADYASPEEVQAAIDMAVAQYKDYLSPEAVEKAKQAAVQKYIDEHPVVEKENKTFFYAFIVVLAALIAVGGVFAYKDFIKPKMAAKKAAVEAAEPPKQ